MLLPYLDMGNLYFSALSQKELGKLDTILNSALRTDYNIRVRWETHNVDIYNRANLFSLTYRRKYFMLNLIHRLIYTGDLELHEPVRVTRRNQAPILITCIDSNQTIAKSPVYTARNLWNTLSIDLRSIVNHDSFKNVIRKNIGMEYTAFETLKLTAGLFQ